MEDAEDLDLPARRVDAVRDDVARAVDDELPRAWAPPRSAHLRLLAQQVHPLEDPVRHVDGGLGVVFAYVDDLLVQIELGQSREDDPKAHRFVASAESFSWISVLTTS